MVLDPCSSTLGDESRTPGRPHVVGLGRLPHEDVVLREVVPTRVPPLKRDAFLGLRHEDEPDPLFVDDLVFEQIAVVAGDRLEVAEVTHGVLGGGVQRERLTVVAGESRHQLLSSSISASGIWDEDAAATGSPANW